MNRTDQLQMARAHLESVERAALALLARIGANPPRRDDASTWIEVIAMARAVYDARAGVRACEEAME